MLSLIAAGVLLAVCHGTILTQFSDPLLSTAAAASKERTARTPWLNDNQQRQEYDENLSNGPIWLPEPWDVQEGFSVPALQKDQGPWKPVETNLENSAESSPRRLQSYRDRRVPGLQLENFFKYSLPEKIPSLVERPRLVRAQPKFADPLAEVFSNDEEVNSELSYRRPFFTRPLPGPVVSHSQNFVRRLSGKTVWKDLPRLDQSFLQAVEHCRRLIQRAYYSSKQQDLFEFLTDIAQFCNCRETVAALNFEGFNAEN